MKKKVYMLLLALGTILLCSCQNQPVSESKSDGQTEENSVEIDLTGNSAECTSKAVEVSEGKVRITDEVLILCREHWKEALSLMQVIPIK